MSVELKRSKNIFGCLRASEEPTASVVLKEPEISDSIFGCLKNLMELQASHGTGGARKIQRALRSPADLESSKSIARYHRDPDFPVSTSAKDLFGSLQHSD